MFDYSGSNILEVGEDQNHLCGSVSRDTSMGFGKLRANHGPVGLASSGIPANCKEVVSSYILGLIQMYLVTTVPLSFPARRKWTTSCKK